MGHEVRLLWVVLAWGCNYWVLPHGVAAMGAGPFTLARFACTLPLLALLWVWRKAPPVRREDWPRVAVFGLIGIAAYQAVFAAAVHATTTTNAAILFSLSPIFGVLLSRVTGREHPSALNWMGLAMAFGGGWVLVMARTPEASLSFEHLEGDLLMLSAALLWAVAAYVAEPVLKKYGGLTVTAWGLPTGLVGLGLWAGADALHVPWTNLPWAAWASLAFAVLLATVLGVVWFYDAVPHLGSGKVMSYMYLTPVVAILVSCVLDGQWVTALEAVGIGLALLGVWLARRRSAARVALPRGLASSAATPASGQSG